jgi:2-iminobutanoate/2-iminopropanoate deaminase
MLEFMTLPNGVLPPVAPYSHAVRAGDFLFVTGQLAEDPQTGEVVKGPIEEQTKQVMDNLQIVLDHSGSSFQKVVMARVFVTDFRYYETVNQIWLLDIHKS